MNNHLASDPLDNLQMDIYHQPHIYITKPKACTDKCLEHDCTNFCPSQVFSWIGSELVVDYTRCVECGACLYSCIHQNIHWEYPRGGFGVLYRY